MKDRYLNRIKNNWKAGVTVALVSIPLSVSLAVASGGTPIQGIITAIWAGLIASIFGGSVFNIVGPAGALSGILAGFALKNGYALLPNIAIVAGVLILIAYLIRLEKYLVYISSSVVHGFTLGVAFMIAWGQINSALGLTGIKAHEKFLQNLLESYSHISTFSLHTFIVFSVFLVGLFLVLKYLPKLPSVLVLTPFGIILGYLSTNNFINLNIATLGSKFANLSGSLFAGYKFGINSEVLVTSLTVAIVAILETMLSAKIADGMTKTKYNKRKEMLGLGLANIVSGLFGGIPATGVLARTSLNVKSGARSKMSATINSLTIAVVSLLLLSYFKYIPLSVIAAILMFVAYRMVDPKHYVNLWHFDKKGFFIAMLVALVTIFDDPIIGIMTGTIISLLILVEKISRGQFEIILNNKNTGIVHRSEGDYLDEIKKRGDTLVYSIKGQLLHLNTLNHLTRFESGLNGYKNIIIRLRELYFIDVDGVECISEIIEDCKKQKRKIVITGVNEFIKGLLKESKEFRELEDDGLIFNKTSDALKYFGYKIK